MTTLPDGWRMTTIEEIASSEPRSITDGPFGSNLTRAHYTASGPRVIRLQNIGDGRFIDAPAHISNEHFESLRTHEVLPGDLLMASLGETLPRACLAPAWLGPAIVKADCIRVRLSDGVDPRWVLYALQRPAVRRWADEHRHGVGRPRLGLKVIRQTPIPLPTLSEQQRIVDILEDHLSHLDAARDYLVACERRLAVAHRAILSQIIPDVASYLPDWETSTVGDAGLVELGRQRHPDWHTGPNMRPYLRVANVFEDEIRTDDLKEMHWPGETFERFMVHPGDILLNEGQTPDLLGRPALYRGDPAEVAFTNSLIRFRAKASVLPEFALLVFRRHMHAKRFKRESRITTNIAHLSAARLKTVEFPIPPLEEQRRLVAQADSLLNANREVRVGISRAEARGEALRRAVLSAAFAGRLTGRLHDLDRVEELVATGVYA